MVAYILAGIVLGPGMAGLFVPDKGPAELGEFGILLLMFFLGLEIEIPAKGTLLWRPMAGQVIKMLLALTVAWLAGAWLAWGWHNRLLLSVLLTFNSTAVVSEYMRQTGELDTNTGKLVLNMLLLQDVLVAPVFAFFQWMGRPATQWPTLLASAAIAIILIFLLQKVRNRDIWSWRGWQLLESDHDMQVFLAASCCLCCALLSSMAGLSGPIGSFAAGMWLGRARGFEWLSRVLKPFKVFFVALYFVSVGLLIDLHFIASHWLSILVITSAVLLTNSLLSAVAFRLLGIPWKDSWWAGALLSQTGELGLLACSMAADSGMIDAGMYKLSVAVTGLALFLSTAWTSGLRTILNTNRSAS
ncbi:cation:proton antiporter [Puia sp. P3]|uniref:cation:proton antiporter domain-containing protein n=1 Tax=Puia sp. P3 TaxID=3423952 RepID=UPI003D667906